MNEPNETSMTETTNKELGLFVTSEDLGLDGDYNATDITVPRIRILNKGNEEFGMGTLVIDDKYRVKPPATIIPVASKKDYIENLEMDSEQNSRTAETDREVKDMGGVIVRREKGTGKFTPRAKVIVAVQADRESMDNPDWEFAYPKKVSDAAGNELRFALCMMTLSRTAYEAMAMPLAQFTQVSRTPMRNYFWHLTPKKITSSSGFTWYVPEVDRLGPVTEPITSMINSIFTSKDSLYGLVA